MEESEKKIQENGSDILEQETNEKDRNGDTVSKKAEEKTVDEKAKKRMGESPPNILKAKRTKSSNGFCC